MPRSFNGAGTVPQPKSYPAAEAEAEANAPRAGYASLYVLEPSGAMHALQAMHSPFAECEYRFYVDGELYWGMRKGKEYSWDLVMSKRRDKPNARFVINLCHWIRLCWPGRRRVLCRDWP